LDFWTQSDRHDDAKADSGSGEEYKHGISQEHLHHDQEHIFRIIGSVVPYSQWTMKRLYILQNFIPQEAVFRIPPSDGLHQYSSRFSADSFLTEVGVPSAITYGLIFSSMLR
jgi:hypothetical protein